MGAFPRSLLTALALAATAACGARTSLEADAGADTASPGITYGAVPFATGMSRFAVFKHDEPRDRCTVVVFVGPVSAPTPDLTLPADWAVESAWYAAASTCDLLLAPAPPAAVIAHATSISGSASWEEPVCEVDVDLSLEFEGGAAERMQAEDVSVGWADCP